MNIYQEYIKTLSDFENVCNKEVEEFEYSTKITKLFSTQIS